jgi:hypothetical protein
MRYLLLLALLCAGCGTLEFQGTSTSLRTLREDPGFGDLYVGADANFAVVPVGETARPAPVTTADRDPYDIWNTPVTYEPSRPSVGASSEQVGTSAEPAFGK